MTSSCLLTRDRVRTTIPYHPSSVMVASKSLVHFASASGTLLPCLSTSRAPIPNSPALAHTYPEREPGSAAPLGVRGSDEDEHGRKRHRVSSDYQETARDDNENLFHAHDFFPFRSVPPAFRLKLGESRFHRAVSRTPVATTRASLHLWQHQSGTKTWFASSWLFPWHTVPFLYIFFERLRANV